MREWSNEFQSISVELSDKKINKDFILTLLFCTKKIYYQKLTLHEIPVNVG